MAQLVIPEFSGDNYFLSNFYHHTQHFPANGKSLQAATAEHVFQAAKYRAMPSLSNDDKIAYVLKVLAAKTPTEARKLGKTAKGLDVKAWDDMKIEVMRQVLVNKFTGPDLRARLLGTGDAMLVEGNTWNDRFWGRCDKKGYNILGVLLMEIRGYIRLSNKKPVATKDVTPPSWSWGN